MKFERNRTENRPKYRAPEAGEKARLSVSEVSAADNCLPEDKIAEVPADLWHIQTESGETPETLSEDVLYEVHVTVEDGGAFDLSDAEKEIKVSAVLGN